MAASAAHATKSSGGIEGEQDILVTRWIDASRDRVWQAFSEANHLDAWWGPHAFRTRTASRDFVLGGLWVYTMFGQDGSVYPNWIRYTRIDPPALMEYEHGGELDTPRHFTVRLHLESEGGGTRISLRLTFPDRAARDAVLQFGAITGGGETLERLEDWVQKRGQA